MKWMPPVAQPPKCGSGSRAEWSGVSPQILSYYENTCLLMEGAVTRAAGLGEATVNSSNEAAEKLRPREFILPQG
jgi:hypothetical protein